MVWKFAQYVDYVHHFSQKILSVASKLVSETNSSVTSTDLHLAEYYKAHANQHASDIVAEMKSSDAVNEKNLKSMVKQQLKPWYLFGNDHLVISDSLTVLLIKLLNIINILHRRLHVH